MSAYVLDYLEVPSADTARSRAFFGKAFGWQFVEVTAWVHPFVQHADDLDHALLCDAIVKNMNRSPDLRSGSRTPRISDMEASDT